MKLTPFYISLYPEHYNSTNKKSRVVLNAFEIYGKKYFSKHIVLWLFVYSL